MVEKLKKMLVVMVIYQRENFDEFFIRIFFSVITNYAMHG